MSSRPILVLNDPHGVDLTLGERPNGSRVVEREGELLAMLPGDVTPFLVDIGGTPYIVFAGTVVGPAIRVELHAPHDPDVSQVLPVHDGVWMSFPAPFRPGMEVTATWHSLGGRELLRLTLGPLDADTLEPVFGPHTVRYGPSE